MKIEGKKLEGDLISCCGFQISYLYWYYCIRFASCGTLLNNGFSGYSFCIVLTQTEAYVCVCFDIHICIYIPFIAANFRSRNLWQLPFQPKILQHKKWSTNISMHAKCTCKCYHYMEAGRRDAFSSWFIGSFWRTEWMWNMRHNTHYSWKLLTMSYVVP